MLSPPPPYAIGGTCSPILCIIQLGGDLDNVIVRGLGKWWKVGYLGDFPIPPMGTFQWGTGKSPKSPRRSPSGQNRVKMGQNWSKLVKIGLEWYQNGSTHPLRKFPKSPLGKAPARGYLGHWIMVQYNGGGAFQHPIG